MPKDHKIERSEDIGYLPLKYAKLTCERERISVEDIAKEGSPNKGLRSPSAVLQWRLSQKKKWNERTKTSGIQRSVLVEFHSFSFARSHLLGLYPPLLVNLQNADICYSTLTKTYKGA